MTVTLPPEATEPVLPSVEDVRPDEEGGPIARTGFNYQDEVVVGFFIEMLDDPTLLKVHCETHDDVLLVRETSGTRTAEFVQVKGGADLIQRTVWFQVLKRCIREHRPFPFTRKYRQAKRRASPRSFYRLINWIIIVA